MDLEGTHRQLGLMNIRWERGSAAVEEAKERLEDDLASTNVLTVLQTLKMMRRSGTRRREELTGMLRW